MSIANYAENKILDALFNNISLAVATPYVPLHTADPGETGASEVAGGSYARQAASFGAASGGQVQNDAILDFAGMPTVTVVGFGIWDAASSGNCLWTGWLRVSCIARRGKLFDPRNASHYGRRDLGSSQNAALAIRDLVTSAEGKAKERYGGGFFFTGSDFLLGTDGRTTGSPPNEAPLTDGNGFVALADFCDEWIHRPGDDATKPPYSSTYASAPPYTSTNGERRCRLNVVLDTPQSLMETVGALAFLGYCFASLQRAHWRFPLDQDGDPVFTFADETDPPNQNASKIVLNMEAWGRTPTGIQGSFWNEVLDFEKDELLFPVDNLPEGSPTNVKQVDLRGVTREPEAARMLRHLAEQAKALPLPVSWEAHPGVQHVEAGDIVVLKTRLPYSTGSKATELKVRVLAGMVGRDEEGRLTVRYTGRVMKSSVYALKSVTVPVSAPPATEKASTAGTPKTTVPTTGQRIITNLRARVG